MNIYAHMLISVSILLISIYLCIDIMNASMPLSWSVFFIYITAVYLPAYCFLKYIPARCRNRKCKSVSMFDTFPIPNWGAKKYKCKRCGYECKQDKFLFRSVKST
jgi:hypothetical protein